MSRLSMRLERDLRRLGQALAARANRARQDYEWRKMKPNIETRYTAQRADYENKRFIAGGDTGIYGRYAPANIGTTRGAN